MKNNKALKLVARGSRLEEITQCSKGGEARQSGKNVI